LWLVAGLAEDCVLGDAVGLPLLVGLPVAAGLPGVAGLPVVVGLPVAGGLPGPAAGREFANAGDAVKAAAATKLRIVAESRIPFPPTEEPGQTECHPEHMDLLPKSTDRSSALLTILGISDQDCR
jgi:hypothetical protein